MSIAHTHPIYEKIKAYIFSQGLEVATPISIESAARMFNCSMIPVREALIRLSAEDLITHEPGRGFFLKPMAFEDVEGSYRLIFSLIRLAIQWQTDNPREVPCLQFITWTRTQKDLSGQLLQSPVYYEKMFTSFIKTICDSLTWSVIHHLVVRTAWFRSKSHLIRSGIETSGQLMVSICEAITCEKCDHALNMIDELETLYQVQLKREYAYSIGCSQE